MSRGEGSAEVGGKCQEVKGSAKGDARCQTWVRAVPWWVNEEWRSWGALDRSKRGLSWVGERMARQGVRGSRGGEGRQTPLRSKARLEQPVLGRGREEGRNGGRRGGGEGGVSSLHPSLPPFLSLLRYSMNSSFFLSLTFLILSLLLTYH